MMTVIGKMLLFNILNRSFRNTACEIFKSVGLVSFFNQTYRTSIKFCPIVGRWTAIRSNLPLRSAQPLIYSNEVELEVRVSAETITLYERIKRNATHTLHNLLTSTIPFIGQKNELSQVVNWLMCQNS